MSEAKKGNSNATGHIVSAQTRVQMSEAKGGGGKARRSWSSARTDRSIGPWDRNKQILSLNKGCF